MPIPIGETVLSAAGDVRANVDVYVYLAGTTTEATVYSDEAMGSTLTQPLSTGSEGNVPGWLDEGAYDIKVGAETTVTRINLVDAQRSVGWPSVLASQIFN